MNNFKWVYLFLIGCQVLYSLYGVEFFPFSTFDTFSNGKKINGQRVYRPVVSNEKIHYHDENIQFHINNRLHWLIEIKKIPFEDVESHFDFPI